jgi:hypothetical protein
MSETCPHVVICGDRGDEIYYGPFESYDDARGWAEIFFLGLRWAVQPLTRPAEPEPGNPDEPSHFFLCPKCGTVNKTPRNVRAGYCFACKDWTRSGRPDDVKEEHDHAS